MGVWGGKESFPTKFDGINLYHFFAVLLSIKCPCLKLREETSYELFFNIIYNANENDECRVEMLNLFSAYFKFSSIPYLRCFYVGPVGNSVAQS